MIWGSFGAHFGSLYESNVFAQIYPNLGHFGSLWAVLSNDGTQKMKFWGHLGSFWSHLGFSLGSFGGHFGSIWGDFMKVMFLPKSAQIWVILGHFGHSEQ